MGQCCCIENNTPSIELTDFRSQSEYNEARKTKSFKVKNEEAKSKLDRVGRKSINTREYEKPQKKVKLRVSITPETQLGKLMHDKTGFRYFHKFLREKNLLMWFDCYVSLLEYEEIPTEEYKQAYSRKIINKYFKQGNDNSIHLSFAPSREKFSSVTAEISDFLTKLIPEFKNTTHYSKYLKSKQDLLRRVYVSDFELYDLLGVGSFGKVLVARKKSTGMFYAMKIIEKSKLIGKNDVRNELDCLISLQNRHIVQLHYAFSSSKFIFLVMDLLRLSFDEISYSSYEDIKIYIFSLVDALLAIHKSGRIYMDLKPNNIMIRSNGELVLTDLGCSEKIDSICKSKIGANGFRAPEVDTGVYGVEVDWWGLGIFIYIQLYNVNPFSPKLNAELKFKEDIPADLKSLIIALLHENPDNRLSDKNILQHPYFLGVENLQDFAGISSFVPEPLDISVEPCYNSIEEALEAFKNIDTSALVLQALGAEEPVVSISNQDQLFFKDFSYISAAAFSDELKQIVDPIENKLLNQMAIDHGIELVKSLLI